MLDQAVGGAAKLAAEWDAFERMRETLLATSRDKWALFKGSDFLGVFETFEAAYTDGVRRYCNQPFLCAHIKDKDWHVEIPALSTGLLYAHF